MLKGQVAKGKLPIYDVHCPAVGLRLHCIYAHTVYFCRPSAAVADCGLLIYFCESPTG